jgi:AraC family transcriptional regulator
MAERDDLQAAVARYLARCFLSGRSPHIGELAGQLGTSALTLGRRFRRSTGQNLGAFLDLQQVLRARRLLRWPGLALPDIARGSAYEHERTFYRAFRRTMGMTPLQFRQQTHARSFQRPCRCRVTCYVEV